jgi:hypothetical protein
MRRLTLLAVLTAAALLPAGPSLAAVEGPWCLFANAGRWAQERCYFPSFEACNRERPLFGSTAHCVQNHAYLPYWTGRGFEPEPRPAVRRKKQRRR